MKMQPERVTDTHVFFWNSVYSQWYSTKNQFKDTDGFCYENSEQYMMMQKAKLMGDMDMFNRMKRVTNPRAVKKLGREVKNFDSELWGANKTDIVTQSSILKFTQNPTFKDIMFSHKDLMLVEASPHDKIWGIGLHFDDDKVLDASNWQGENLLGKCLMEARDIIAGLENRVLTP